MRLNEVFVDSGLKKPHWALLAIGLFGNEGCLVLPLLLTFAFRTC